MKWSKEEVKIVKQYEHTVKSMSDIHNDLFANGYDRTFKAVTRKIESMRLNKPFKKMNVANLPKILILDIETTPIAVWTWRLGNQYINPVSIMKDDKGELTGEKVKTKYRRSGDVIRKVVTDPEGEKTRTRYDKEGNVKGGKEETPTTKKKKAYRKMAKK